SSNVGISASHRDSTHSPLSRDRPGIPRSALQQTRTLRLECGYKAGAILAHQAAKRMRNLPRGLERNPLAEVVLESASGTLMNSMIPFEIQRRQPLKRRRLDQDVGAF